MPSRWRDSWWMKYSGHGLIAVAVVSLVLAAVGQRAVALTVLVIVGGRFAFNLVVRAFDGSE